MTPILANTEVPDAQISRIFGVVIGLVTNNQDPEKLGRVKVKFPWLSASDESTWARVVTPMAGKERGFYFLPETDDEVLVVFEHGDMRFPYVLGALWNGEDKPPVEQKQGNHVRVIKSRSGHVIRLTDEKAKEKIEIIDTTTKNSLVFDAASNTITITADRDIKLSAPKGKITLDAKEIEIKSSANTSIQAQANTTIESTVGMKLKASETMTIKGAVVNIN
jgi:uncharacterized protein involved in type VI secretion and phage assembly